MSLSAQLKDSSSKQVQLHGHLGGHGRINDGCKFMSSKDPDRIVPEVKYRDELVVTDPLQPHQGQLSLLLKADVVPGDHDCLRDELPEVCPHLVVAVIQERCHLLNGE